MILKLVCLALVLGLSESKAISADPATDALVEVVKQKLVRFPDEVNQQDSDVTKSSEKQDEAKRILEQINKINQAFGYVKKQPEQSRISPILDSSQFLFPKPSYHPFSSQTHQFSGSNGETLLLPSIRAYKFSEVPLNQEQYLRYQFVNNYQTPPVRTHSKQQSRKLAKTNSNKSQKSDQQLQIMNLEEYRDYLNKLKQSEEFENFYREVQRNSAKKQQPLPTHFMIPVKLYKLNKEEYLKKPSTQDYRFKGYKIVGDIDNFYGRAASSSKTKSKTNKNSSSSKASNKYHLFFLPRDLALSEPKQASTHVPVATAKPPKVENPTRNQDYTSREEKLRPLRVQATSITTNTNSQNGAVTNATASTQVIRKRIVPKPQKVKDTTINSIAQQQIVSGGGAANFANTVKITPSPLPLNTQEPQSNSLIANNQNNNQNHNQNQNQNHNQNHNQNQNQNHNQNLNKKPNQNQIQNQNQNANPNNNPNSLQTVNGNQNKLGFLNRPNLNINLDSLNANPLNINTSNAIKTAFQNIFKFPFRQEAKPEAQQVEANDQPIILESVPLQIPQKTFFTSHSFMGPSMTSLYQKPANDQQLHEQASQAINDDYNWDDDSFNNNNGNSNNDDLSLENPDQHEKQLFGHFHAQKQETQKEALRQGGIIIQKLKVRKGGIAIAGPGGVATAGSGGTAIVGPGGYALTHPRSLTIAGPGAKIIAIPANIDLKDALQRTNLDAKSFPTEGKIVATGPTVYYSPGTPTSSSEEI